MWRKGFTILLHPFKRGRFKKTHYSNCLFNVVIAMCRILELHVERFDRHVLSWWSVTMTTKNCTTKCCRKWRHCRCLTDLRLERLWHVIAMGCAFTVFSHWPVNVPCIQTRMSWPLTTTSGPTLCKHQQTVNSHKCSRYFIETIINNFITF